MHNIGQLRIFVSESYFPIFYTISHNKLFKQNSEFFIFCTFVGEKNKRKVELTKRQELCRAVTLTTYDQTAIRALYLKEHGALSSFKDVVELAEKYANGGLEYLIENTLSDVAVRSPIGTWGIKPSMEEELQLILLNYVLDERQVVPF